MKKLEISQMENFIASGKNRDCALMGLSIYGATFLGFMAGSYWGAGAAAYATVQGAISMGCFS